MNADKAKEIADRLLQKYGLTHLGWKFKFDSAKRRFGVCKYRPKLISLSLALTELNSEEQVTDTILHEIAHALVGPKHGHDSIWKAKAREVGCKAERCYSSEVVRPKGNYEAECGTCGHVHIRIKKPTRTQSCGCCSRTFNPKYTLVWKPTK